MDRSVIRIYSWFAVRGVVLSTFLLVCLCARADTTFWTNFGGGDFNVPGNWFPSMPDPDDTAVFRTLPGNGYVVGVYDSYFVDRLIVGSNDVTFRDAGISAFGRLFASNTNVGSVTPALLVGEQSNDVAILNVELFELKVATATIAAAAGSSGEINVHGGGLHNLHVTGVGSAHFDNFTVGERGVGLLNIRDGSHATVTGGMVLAQFAGSGASVVVEGIDSTLTLVPNFTGFANLTIGSAGTAQLLVIGGGSVANSSAYLGGINSTGSGTGNVLVAGPNSFWINSQEVIVGFTGDGHLTVDGGGHVASAEGDIAEFAGTSGEVIVAGANSEWSMSGDLRVGVVGEGTLSILVGGHVGNRGAHIAEGSGSSGLVTVDGTGSRWTNQSGLIVGAGGTGTLNVTGGGQVTSSGDAVIGRDNGSSGAVTVAGSGSTWTVSGSSAAIYVGNFGTGTLTVNDGGVVSAAGASLRIGPLGTVKGNGTIIANVVNDGKMAPGNSPGTLLIDGNYEQTAGGVLELEIGGTAAGQFDQLIVDGNARLQGDVVLQLVNGFLPRAGDQFSLLDVTGTFTNSADLSFTGAAASWQFSQAFDSMTHTWVITSLSDALRLIPGDYNQNGTVDAADYVVWRNGLGTIYTQNEYNVWRANFGRTAGSDSGAAGSAVPEPATLLLLVGAAAIVAAHRRVD